MSGHCLTVLTRHPFGSECLSDPRRRHKQQLAAPSHLTHFVTFGSSRPRFRQEANSRFSHTHKNLLMSHARRIPSVVRPFHDAYSDEVTEAVTTATLRPLSPEQTSNCELCLVFTTDATVAVPGRICLFSCRYKTDKNCGLLFFRRLINRSHLRRDFSEITFPQIASATGDAIYVSFVPSFRFSF